MKGEGKGWQVHYSIAEMVVLMSSLIGDAGELKIVLNTDQVKMALAKYYHTEPVERFRNFILAEWGIYIDGKIVGRWSNDGKRFVIKVSPPN